ncbi:MAG: hypothetical protein KatS3mg089_0948 [Patescibacteria group bacterium]|nr:MAG: hypothetical protein KatS3mg089_0948 [Patescibacteria group bacterium]
MKIKNVSLRLSRYKKLFIELFSLILLTISVLLLVTQLRNSQNFESRARAFETVFSFGAVGDIGATSNSSAVLSAITPSAVNFFLALGDLSYNQITPESAWCNYVKQKVGNDFPFELVAGNHEDDGPDGQIANFASCLPDRLGTIVGTYPKEYYFDYPTTNPIARFILISPNLTFPNEGTYSYAKNTPRYEWTKNAIDSARAQGIKWIIVGMHKYCIAMVSGSCQIGADIMNLLIEKKVDLYLQAHDHAYARSKQLALSSLCTAITPGSYNSNCVVDDGADNIYIKGQGTIILTIGQGGRSLNKQYTSDSEAKYFANWMGSNFNPTYGFIKFTVSDSRIQAEFVKGLNLSGNFTENFSIIDNASQISPTVTPTPTLNQTTPTPTPTQQPTPTPTPSQTPATITLDAVADTYVSSSNPTVNYGASTSLYSDASPIMISYLKFDTSGLNGILKKATLRIRTTSGTYSGSPGPEYVKIVEDTSWSESMLTYNTRPSLSTTLGSVSNTISNTTYDIPLDTTIIQSKLGGIISLGVDTQHSDAFYFNSKETSSKPQIILEF